MTDLADDADDARAKLALADTLRVLVGSALLLCAGGLACALSEGAVSPIAVALVALVVAGERLWRCREQIPSELPPPPPQAHDVPSWRPGWFGLLMAVVMFGVMLGLGKLLGGGAVAMVGVPAGFLLHDVVMAACVAHWQSRHHHRLVWIRDGGDVASYALPADV